MWLNWTKILWVKYAMIILLGILADQKNVLACDEICQQALLGKFKTALKFALQEFKVEMVQEMKMNHQDIQTEPSSDHQDQNLLQNIENHLQVIDNKLEYITDRVNDAEIRLVDLDINTAVASGRSDQRLQVTTQVKVKQEQLYLEVQNIASTVDTLGEKLSSIENTTNKIVDNISLLEENVSKNLTDVFDYLGDSFNSLEENVIQKLSSYENTTNEIVDIIILLEENVLQNLTDVFDSFNDRFSSVDNKTNNIVRNIISLEENVIQDMTDVVDSLGEGLSSKENETTNMFSNVISLAEIVIQNLTDVADSFDERLSSLENETINMIGKVTSLEEYVIHNLTKVIEKNNMKENMILLQDKHQQVLSVVTTIKEHTSNLTILPKRAQTLPTKIACEAPWVYLNGAGCFLFNKGDLIDWDTAQTKCKTYICSDLAILNTATKRQAVANHIESTGDTGKAWWVGGNKRSGSWVWLDGQPITGDWGNDPQQPNDDGENNCAYLQRPVHYGGTLWDFRCDKTWSGFICQK